MTVIKEAVYALHQRIKDLAIDAPADQLAYLAKALELIAGRSTVDDIVNMSDEKLKELLDATNTAKTTALSAIDSAKASSIDEINTNKEASLAELQTAATTNLSLLDTRKDASIAAVTSQAFDVPADSTIMKEINKKEMIGTGALPFIFGVLNYNGDFFIRSFSISSFYPDDMFKIIAGLGSSGEYHGFYRPPQLYFLQGSNGNFFYKEVNLRHSGLTDRYLYAGIGVIFVKNTTANDITGTISFGGSCNWEPGDEYSVNEYSTYKGIKLFTATPNGTNDDKSSITSLTWTSIYEKNKVNEENKDEDIIYNKLRRIRASTGNIASNVRVTIPSGKTVAILLYTPPYKEKEINNGYYVEFLHWCIFEFRHRFLTGGLEVDIERTLKTWQSRNIQYTYELWK